MNQDQDQFNDFINLTILNLILKLFWIIFYNYDRNHKKLNHSNIFNGFHILKIQILIISRNLMIKIKKDLLKNLIILFLMFKIIKKLNINLMIYI